MPVDCFTPTRGHHGSFYTTNLPSLLSLFSSKEIGMKCFNDSRSMTCHLRKKMFTMSEHEAINCNELQDTRSRAPSKSFLKTAYLDRLQQIQHASHKVPTDQSSGKTTAVTVGDSLSSTFAISRDLLQESG